ncbi:uncharacterized protein LOC124538748 isoform X2 [Vanessa cardui]|uniref:uncharacterized protein LOC124538748 isoform X2 n=1 Tax=Vanessa cardui TaxID=171605 RepID=UPI001F12D68F|nr:uncharacterized protein LOC124538748 isoform X2 [Vanessa cardui]
MNQEKRKRSENWTTEEKDILREMIGQSCHIIENRCTKASSNNKKTQEWRDITKRLNELTGKCRSDADVKLAWKRMKLAAKANLSTHWKDLAKTGGGNKPKSPSQEDLATMNIVPCDFILEYNNFDSDAMRPEVELNVLGQKNNHMEAGPSTAVPPIEFEENNEVQVEKDQGTSNNVNVGTATKERVLCKNSEPKNKKNKIAEDILRSNREFKEKQLEMLDLEHKYKIETYNLKIKKLKLQIEALEHSKKSSAQ